MNTRTATAASSLPDSPAPSEPATYKDPQSGFLLTLHITIWTTLTLGLIAVMVVVMLK